MFCWSPFRLRGTHRLPARPDCVVFCSKSRRKSAFSTRVYRLMTLPVFAWTNTASRTFAPLVTTTSYTSSLVPGLTLDEARPVDHELIRFRAEVAGRQLGRDVVSPDRRIGDDGSDRPALACSALSLGSVVEVDGGHDRAVDRGEVPGRVDVRLEDAPVNRQSVVSLLVRDVRHAERVGGRADLFEIGVSICDPEDAAELLQETLGFALRLCAFLREEVAVAPRLDERGEPGGLVGGDRYRPTGTVLQLLDEGGVDLLRAVRRTARPAGSRTRGQAPARGLAT